MIVALKAIYWLTKENIPLIKFQSLLEFLRELKTPDVEHLLCGEKNMTVITLLLNW